LEQTSEEYQEYEQQEAAAACVEEDNLVLGLKTLALATQLDPSTNEAARTKLYGWVRCLRAMNLFLQWVRLYVAIRKRVE
jgi:hypothetical protein